MRDKCVVSILLQRGLRIRSYTTMRRAFSPRQGSVTMHMLIYTPTQPLPEVRQKLAPQVPEPRWRVAYLGSVGAILRVLCHTSRVGASSKQPCYVRHHWC